MSFFYFLKDNSYTVVKLLVYQLGMTIFGSCISMAVQSSRPLLLATGIFATLFFVYLIYSALWEIGAKDKIRTDAGRLLPRPLFGLHAALLAGMPNYILLTLMLIGFFFGRGENGLEWAGNLFVVTQVIFKILNGMYIGIIRFFLPDGAVVSALNLTLCLCTVLPALLAAHIGYTIGAHGKTFLGLLGLKRKTDRKG